MKKRPRKQPPIGLLHEREPALRGQRLKPRDPAQPQLPFDPMPRRIEPCIPVLINRPPVGPQWAFEVKWDGYRVAVHIEPDRVRILTKNGHDWTDRFPAIEVAARSLGVTAILDGEAVVLDDQGRSDFNALLKALGGRAGKRRSDEVILYAFDLLYVDGHDLQKMELSSRRHLLGNLIGDGQGAIRFSEEMDGDGQAFFDAACEYGLEGIVGKRRDRPYRSGRGDWVKIKCKRRDAFIVVGYEISGSSIRRLLLAARKDEIDLVYVGSVGTGFSQVVARELKTVLDLLKVKKPPISMKTGLSVLFAQPTLIVEVEYRAWTHDGKLRQPSYKGLLEVQDNAAIYRMEN